MEQIEQNKILPHPSNCSSIEYGTSKSITVLMEITATLVPNIIMKSKIFICFIFTDS